MNAYVLGNHDGDLPTYLLAEDEAGNRVRAIARLDGTAHDAYFAIEASTEDDVERLIAKIEAAGTTLHKKVIGSEDQGITRMLDRVPHPPSGMPPYACVAFILLEADDIILAAHAAMAALGGRYHVAAATDGTQILVQLGHHNREVLDAVARAFVVIAGGTHTGAHVVAGSILRA